MKTEQTKRTLSSMLELGHSWNGNRLSRLSCRSNEANRNNWYYLLSTICTFCFQFRLFLLKDFASYKVDDAEQLSNWLYTSFIFFQDRIVKFRIWSLGVLQFVYIAHTHLPIHTHHFYFCSFICSQNPACLAVRTLITGQRVPSFYPDSGMDVYVCCGSDSTLNGIHGLFSSRV